MSDAPSDKNDSKTPIKIIEEFKEENLLFSVPCSRFYYNELSHLVGEGRFMGNRIVKLFWYLRVICRNYPEPPAGRVLRVYFPKLHYNDIQKVTDIPDLATGESFFIPKVCIRDLLLKGSGQELLVLALCCYLTNRRGVFQFIMKNHALSPYIISRTVSKLRILGYIERVQTRPIERRSKGQKWKWTILRA